MESALLARSVLSWVPYRSSTDGFLPSISHQQKPNVLLTSCPDSHLLGTIITPFQLIHHLGSSNSAIHTFPNNSSEGLSDVQLQWKQVKSRCHCKPRLVCLFGSKGRGSDKYHNKEHLTPGYGALEVGERPVFCVGRHWPILSHPWQIKATTRTVTYQDNEGLQGARVIEFALDNKSVWHH